MTSDYRTRTSTTCPSISLTRKIGPALVVGFAMLSVGSALFFNGHALILYSVSGTTALAALILAIVLTRGTALHVGPAGAFILAHFLWNVAALAWTTVPYVTALEVGLLGSGVMLYAIWRLCGSAHEDGLFTRTICIGLGLAFALAMFLQYIIGVPPHAMLANPNSAAGFLNYLWPFAATAWLASERSTHTYSTWLLPLAIFFMVAALALDGSRGAMIGAAASLTVVFWFGTSALRDFRATLIVSGIIASAVLFASLLGSSAFSSSVGAITNPEIASPSRFEIWRATWSMISDHAWLGFGPGTFWLAYTAYRLPGDRSAGLFAHNDYLEFWVEGGLPNLLLAIGVGIACLGICIYALRSYRCHLIDKRQTALAVACFAGIVGVSVHGLFTFNYQMMPFVLLLCILVAELENRSVIRPVLSIRLLHKPLRLAPVIAILAVSVIPALHFSRTLLASEYVATGAEQAANGNHATAASAYINARTAWAQIDVPWYLHASVLIEAMRGNREISQKQRRDMVNRASALLDSAAERNPLRSTIPLLRGKLRSDHPDLITGSAEAALRHALQLDPRNIEARYALSQVLEQNKDIGTAKTVLREGLVIGYPRGTNTDVLRARLNRIAASEATSGRPARKSSFGHHSSDSDSWPKP